MRCFRLVLLCTLESVSQLIFLFIQRDGDLTAVHQRTKQQFVGERFSGCLDDTRHRTCAHCGRNLSRPASYALLAHFQRNTFLIQLNLQLDDEFIHHLMDHVG